MLPDHVERRAVSDSAPLFIHAWWRSSSTYVWSKLRQDQSLCCYYEPLNERIATLTPEVIRGGAETGMSRALRHPVQRENYFTEYLDLIAAGDLHYSRDLAYARYFLHPEQADDRLRAYLEGLISAASRSGRKPVLCFCRSQMRSAWMRRHLGGVHVCQIRNPFDQWASFRVNPYFPQRMVNVALRLRAQHPSAFAHIEPFERQAQRHSEQGARGEQQNLRLSRHDALNLFLLIWAASALQAIACCDYVLDVDRLSADERYRQESADWFRRSGCAVSFADCAAPATEAVAENFAQAVEKTRAALQAGASGLVVSSSQAIAKRLPGLYAASRQVLERLLA